MLVCADFNGHVRKVPEDFNGVPGGHGFGSYNADGIIIFNINAAGNLDITTTYAMKPDSHLVTL